MQQTHLIMEDILVNCNHCGNVLETKSYKKIETCPYCNTLLEIIRMGGSIYTKIHIEDTILAASKLPELPPKEIVDPKKNKRLELILFNQSIHKQITVLDNQWQRELSKYNSNKNENKLGISLVVSTVGILFFLLGISLASFFILIAGILSMLFGIGYYRKANDRKISYTKTKKLHEQKRNELRAKLKVIP